MKEEQYFEKADRVHEWMNLNPHNEWVQKTGTIWLNHMLRRSQNANESA